MVADSVEQLTRAFYAWEAIGRGWQSFNHLVYVEPLFFPFTRYQPDTPVIDDARKPTWFSRLVETIKSRRPEQDDQALVDGESDREAADQIPLEEACEPVSWCEFDLFVPPDLRIDERAAVAWLCSLSTCRSPVAFEIVGTGHSVSLHLSCDQQDVGLVVGQARAFFPGIGLREAGKILGDRWQQTPGQAVAVVEFGLAREFMVPLRTSWDGRDPLTPLIGGLAQVTREGMGLVQLVFEPARAPWAESIRQAVTTPGGDPFFADAPELTTFAKEKTASPLFGVLLRIAAKATDEEAAWDTVRCVAGGLGLLGSPSRNELVPLASDDRAIAETDVLSRTTHRSGMIWSADELAGLVHPPDRSVQVSGLRRSAGEETTAPAEVLKAGVVLGETTHRGEKVVARLSSESRLKHLHVVGASGTGKSTLLVSLILQDIEAGAGVGVIDPHGDLIDEVLGRLPADRDEDVVLFDPADDAHVVGWNILRAHTPAEKEMLASDLVAVFRRLSTSWGDQMTAVLANAILAFLESSRSGTLTDLRRFLVDEEFREEFLQTVQDLGVVSFWRQEFSLLVGKKPQAPILTRLDTFLRSRLVREAVTEEVRPLDFRGLVDSNRIFLGRLSQGAIGQENAALLGALLVSKFHQVCLTRQDQAATERRPFFLYVDEFQDVVTPSMGALFSGVRKYNLGITVAHQDLYQLHARVPEVERAVLGNAYTRICFRVGEEDARRLERGLGRFTGDDLMNLKTGEAICRVGRKEDDFRLKTLPLAEVSGADERRIELRARSNNRFGRPRGQVTAPKAPQVRVLPAVEPASQDQQGVEEAVPPEPIRAPVAVPAATRGMPKVAIPREPGRGGPEHKYLQELIRQWGQQRGFRALIEHCLPDGGRVDVLLERDGLAVACEVAMTTSVEQEMANVAKCLAGGFAHVIVVSLRKGFLKDLEKAVKKELREEFERVKFMAPEELLGFLDELAAGPSGERVAGYAVRVRYRPMEPEEAAARQRAMTEIMVESLRRMKGTGS